MKKERQQSNINVKSVRLQVYELCNIIKYIKIVCSSYHRDHRELAACRPLFNLVVMLAVVCDNAQACF